MRIDSNGIHLRQSDITAFMACPEQYRRTNFDPTYVGSESDAALVGTSLHALIAEELDNGFYDRQFDAACFALDYLRNAIESFELAGTPYNRESFKTDDKAGIFLANVCQDWFHSEERRYLQSVDPQDRLVEWEFDVPFTTLGDTAIWLTGTSDLVLPRRNQVWDWKTAGRDYELWEKQRWAIQPTVYLYAAIHEGHVGMDANGLAHFEYKVFQRGTLGDGGKADPKPGQTYPVTRSDASFKFLEKTVRNMVNMQLTLGTDVEWPLNDSGWHCSPKWCAFFADCKGKLIDPDKNWT